mmetsp:Transcript_4560/g.3833  ORF Transcript_4560/g.3833 Transcript_4560/m.3833 type:complete len:231 (-) Transcript_4560:25-717(-)
MSNHSPIFGTGQEFLFDTSSISSLRLDTLDIEEAKNLIELTKNENIKNQRKDDQCTKHIGSQRNDASNSSKLAFQQVDTSVGSVIVNCFHKQKLEMNLQNNALKQNGVNTGLETSNLRSPFLLQNKIENNKCSEYKSTTEGSCIDDSKKTKNGSIMESYLNINNSNNLKNPLPNNPNITSLIGSKISNNSISSISGQKFGFKKKPQPINSLSLSLIGGMIKEHQTKKYKY